MNYKSIKGVSLMLCIGTYGGFNISVPPFSKFFRISLGWVSVGIYPYDMENAISNKLDERDYYKQALQNYNKTTDGNS